LDVTSFGCCCGWASLNDGERARADQRKSISSSSSSSSRLIFYYYCTL
jgi:hypothetical protein